MKEKKTASLNTIQMAIEERARKAAREAKQKAITAIDSILKTISVGQMSEGSHNSMYCSVYLKCFDHGDYALKEDHDRQQAALAAERFLKCLAEAHYHHALKEETERLTEEILTKTVVQL